MDEVGAHGQGESVWLGWFLGFAARPFAAVADSRGDGQQAALYRAHATRLAEALEEAWDGEWYRRAYFDDGTPLGSHQNTECRIDAIAQSWAAISGIGDPARAAPGDAFGRSMARRSGGAACPAPDPAVRQGRTEPRLHSRLCAGRAGERRAVHARGALGVLAHALLGHGEAAHELLSSSIRSTERPIRLARSAIASSRMRLRPTSIRPPRTSDGAGGPGIQARRDGCIA